MLHYREKRERKAASLNHSENVCATSVHHTVKWSHSAWDIPITPTLTHDDAPMPAHMQMYFCLPGIYLKYKYIFSSLLREESAHFDLRCSHTFENRIFIFSHSLKYQPLYVFFALCTIHVLTIVFSFIKICIYKIEIFICMWAIYACSAHINARSHSLQTNREIKWKNERKSRWRRRRHINASERIMRCTQHTGPISFFMKNEKTETVQPRQIECEQARTKEWKKINI